MSVELVTPAAPAEADAPVNIITPQDATAEHIARGLSPEQAKAFRAQRKEKKAKAAAAVAAAPAVEAEPEKLVADVEPESITFDTPETPVSGEETPAEDLSEAELAKLDEKARKRITEASKEAAKVRKRAQEAEAKVTELETKLADIEKQDGEAAVRAAGLAGNAFVLFKDAHEVATWGENAKEAKALLAYHEREVKAGRRDTNEPVTHTLPNGQEVELRLADLATYEQRITDAQDWFTHDAKVGKVRESAAKLAEKHAPTKGYKEARETYLKDASLPTRLEELVAKAALYDVLQSRRAVITFPDTAGAANKAPTSKEESTQRKDPPSESRASTPRLAAVNDSGSDLAARKSLLMEKARTAKTEDERQKHLKEAIKLGPMPRMARAG